MSDSISIIVTSGHREKLQMAAMVASVGAVSGAKVTVFLSMNALDHFRKGGPGEAPNEGAFGTLLRDKKAPEFKTLFEQAVELGNADVRPCSMAMDVSGLQPSDLESYIGEPLGLTKFLDDARGSQIYTF